MIIKIPEPSKKALEKNEWNRAGLTPIYSKKVNNYLVYVQLSNGEFPHDCWVPFAKFLTPDDLIAIGNELKKLEKN